MSVRSFDVRRLDSSNGESTRIRRTMVYVTALIFPLPERDYTRALQVLEAAFRGGT